MDLSTFLKYLTLIYMIGVGIWFATAQAKFSSSSKAKPLLFVMVACSLTATLMTFIVTLGVNAPLWRIVVAIITTTLCVVLIRSAFASIAKKNLGLVFSGIVPAEIVQHGPYRFVRHPLYLAYSLFWIGCAVFSGSIIVGISVVIIIAFYVAAARSEERDLMSSTFGSTYAEYRRRTGLIFPRIVK